MKNLFYLFMRANSIWPTDLKQESPSSLSIRFNEWLSKRDVRNEANKFMIRKWIVNGVFSSNF